MTENEVNRKKRVECPFIGNRVSCFACGSSSFNIDTHAPRFIGLSPEEAYLLTGIQPSNQQKIITLVPGRCDDCGYTWGEYNQAKD